MIEENGERRQNSVGSIFCVLIPMVNLNQYNIQAEG